MNYIKIIIYGIILLPALVLTAFGRLPPLGVVYILLFWILAEIILLNKE